MAIYHLSAKPPIARSRGRSSTAAAAYRAGIAIRDTRTGQLFDYSKRHGVIDAHLIIPGGRQLTDRAEFWNRVELHHRRNDAVVAREVIVALPREIDAGRRAALALAFSEQIAQRFDVAVDCALHEPSVDGDDRNYHAHLLMTACTVESDGKLGKKSEGLDPIACRRSGSADSVAWLRPLWADLVNAALASAARPERVDHRSNHARGIQFHPTVHVGMVGRGKARRTAHNTDLRARNRELAGLDRDIEELSRVHRSMTVIERAARRPKVKSHAEARRRAEVLLALCADAEARYSLLPSTRCFDKFQLKQLIAVYGAELRSLKIWGRSLESASPYGGRMTVGRA